MVIFTQLPDALVTHAFTWFAYTGVATVVPLSAYSLTLAVPGPAQTLYFHRFSLQPLPTQPAPTLYHIFLGAPGKTMSGLYTPLSFLSKVYP